MRISIVAAAAGAILVAAGSASAWAQQPLSPAQRDSVQRWTAELAPELAGTPVPLEGAVVGSRSVPAGTSVPGNVTVLHGDVLVAGRVDGGVAAIDGNVVLHRGAIVTGNAIAVGGTVVDSGATVGGEIRSLRGPRAGIAALVRPPSRAVPGTLHALGLALAWFAVLGVIGLIVLLITPANLESVAEVIAQHFGRAFLIGLAGEVLALPMLALVIGALAITIIGLVVIPFAGIAFMLGTAGAISLGFLGMAYANGSALGSARTGGSPFARRSRTLLAGLSIYVGLWLLAAVFTWAGLLGVLLRAAAAIVTWVAVTVGLGATILSRGGTRKESLPTAAEPAAPVTSMEWQTPTPVSGVAAARRPTPAPRMGEKA